MLDVPSFLAFYEALPPGFSFPEAYQPLLESLRRPAARVVLHKPPRSGGSTVLQRLLMFARQSSPTKLAAYFTYAEALAGTRVAQTHRLLNAHRRRMGQEVLESPPGRHHFGGYIHGMVGLGRPPGVDSRPLSLVVVDGPTKEYAQACMRREQLRVCRWFSREDAGQQRGLLHEVAADVPLIVAMDYRHEGDVVDFLTEMGFTYFNVPAAESHAGPVLARALKDTSAEAFASAVHGVPAPLRD